MTRTVLIALCFVATSTGAFAGDDFWPSFSLASAQSIANFSSNASASHLTTLPPVSMTKLTDSTYSWQQPADDSFGGYNGRCGETAAANIVSMIDLPKSPNNVAKYMSDATPGTKPSTLKAYLQNNAPGTWETYASDPVYGVAQLKYMLSSGTFKAKNGNSPVAALIQMKKFTLHWVTVVRIDQSNNVYFNHSGRQQVMSEAKFLEHWGFRIPASNAGARAAFAAACCSPYTTVSQVE